MIRSLILYYLNVKPTHGYEIQKFLQVSGIDNWAKIQSGSIYYALTKLDKDGCVEVLKEEKNGSRIRKIYVITDKGKQKLQEDLQQELLTPIAPVGSDKFFLNNILDELPKSAIIATINKHLADLKEQKEYWEKWRQAKTNTVVPGAEKIAFDMTIDSLKYQILWHEEILNHIDQYITLGKETRRIIQTIDFSAVDDEDTITTSAKLLDIQKLRDEIINDPSKAVENIDRLIEQLKKKK
ncbi:PadR family transcriptional regulator [Paenibacillus sp. CAA11]|uniref:PadR family transcriptional regulator n=1 Tax=Paenibacillus sp. CAA11 TaxID=1532905 RepID=UPI000D38CF19|nr:PadR family transcriptional regulator [Paenibacillus sp. CAA11]AWB43565.1 PadR family transcriptional regulator [Paenibacillus sp. CAA11]